MLELATKRKTAVRWGVARSIFFAWVFTLPCAGACAALVWWITDLIFG